MSASFPLTGVDGHSRSNSKISNLSEAEAFLNHKSRDDFANIRNISIDFMDLASNN